MSSANAHEGDADNRHTPTAVEDLSLTHAGEWILLRVTERDRFDVPTRGVVVTTGKSRSAIQWHVLEKAQEARESGEQFYIFLAGSRNISGTA